MRSVDDRWKSGNAATKWQMVLLTVGWPCPGWGPEVGPGLGFGLVCGLAGRDCLSLCDNTWQAKSSLCDNLRTDHMKATGSLCDNLRSLLPGNLTAHSVTKEGQKPYSHSVTVPRATLWQPEDSLCDKKSTDCWANWQADWPAGRWATLWRCRALSVRLPTAWSSVRILPGSSEEILQWLYGFCPSFVTEWAVKLPGSRLLACHTVRP